MASSFEKIDYRMRPAKAVERRMMAEAFLRLRAFGSIESYRYVGMGSVYFSDFSLFHNICGFESMVSIEGESDLEKQNRFKFNVPLGSIDLRFGYTNDVLPQLPWDLRTVVWLDYDGVLDKSVLNDLRFLAGRLTSGGLISMTLNLTLNDEDSGDKPRLEVLRERLGGTDHIPPAILAANLLRPQEVAAAIRDIVNNQLQEGLNERNAGRPAGQKLVKEQVFYFRYKDSAPMMTIGWVLFDEGQRANFRNCGFETLSFFRSDGSPFIISPPLLTGAEIREINRCDETGTFRLLKDLPFPSGQVEKYQSLRRYWPVTNLAENA